LEWIKRLGEKANIGRDQSGVTLIETVIAIALLGIFGVVFLASLSTSTVTTAGLEDKANVDNLARAQMEYTKNINSCPYDSLPPYNYQALDQLEAGNPYIIAVPDGYSISVTAAALHNPDDGIQEITVTIYREGINRLMIKGYKVNR
jgi:prepilin-type N-terminal cleavage/methylation domain-containing protein